MSPSHGITKSIGISVTPGFSPVQLHANAETVSTVFILGKKAVETARALGFRYHPAEAGCQ
jgi:hypothetical protein